MLARLYADELHVKTVQVKDRAHIKGFSRTGKIARSYGPETTLSLPCEEERGYLRWTAFMIGVGRMRRWRLEYHEMCKAEKMDRYIVAIADSRLSKKRLQSPRQRRQTGGRLEASGNEPIEV